MKNKNILVAEDDLALGELIKETLSGDKYTVTLASNGKEALEHFQANEYNVVITDIQMPVMEGPELIGHIKETGKDPMIFVMTANDDRNQIIEIMKQGVYDYLLKPLDISDLLKKVDRAFENYDLTQMKVSIEKERAVRFENQLEWVNWVKKVESSDTSNEQILFQNMHISFSQGVGFGALITLLNIIASSAEKENDYYKIPADIMETVNKNAKVAEKAITMFSRIEWIISNKLPMKETTGAGLYQLIKGLEKKLNKYAQIKSNKIIFSDLKPDFQNCKLYISEEYAIEAFYELLINALKFSEKDSEIFVMFEELQDRFSVSIINVPFKDEKGRKGILQEYENLIFEPFYRMTRTVSEEYDTFDYGLGLTVVDKIIEKHGGSIYGKNIVDHTNVKAGPKTKVDFNVTIPLIKK